eukprot:3181013-Rhodomonas_salina.1
MLEYEGQVQEYEGQILQYGRCSAVWSGRSVLQNLHSPAGSPPLLSMSSTTTTGPAVLPTSTPTWTLGS